MCTASLLPSPSLECRCVLRAQPRAAVLRTCLSREQCAHGPRESRLPGALHSSVTLLLSYMVCAPVISTNPLQLILSLHARAYTSAARLSPPTSTCLTHDSPRHTHGTTTAGTAQCERQGRLARVRRESRRRARRTQGRPHHGSRYVLPAL